MIHQNYLQSFFKCSGLKTESQFGRSALSRNIVKSTTGNSETSPPLLRNYFNPSKFTLVSFFQITSAYLLSIKSFHEFEMLPLSYLVSSMKAETIPGFTDHFVSKAQHSA